MRRILCFFLLTVLLCVDDAHAALNVLQRKISTRAVGAGSANNAFASNVTAGSALFACAAVFNPSGGVSAPTDNVNAGAYSTGFTVNGDSGSSCGCYYKLNVAAGATTVSVDPPGGSADIDLVVIEVAGGSTIDKSAITAMAGYSAPSGATTAVTTGTLAQAAEYVLSCFSHTGPGNALTGDTADGFALVDEDESNTGGQAFHIQDKITAATTSLAINGTIAAGGTGGPTWFTGLVSLREGASDTTVPSDPSDLIVTATGSETTALNWTASTDNVAIGTYRVERCTGAACSSYVEVGAPATNSYADSGLTANTLYRYRVRAADTSLNFSGYTSTVDATTLQVRQATLSWTDTNSSPNEDNYKVRRKTGPNGTYAIVTTTAANATSYVDTTSPVSTLDDSACYQVYATAAGSNDSVFSNEVCTNILIEIPPDGLGSQAVGVTFNGGFILR